MASLAFGVVPRPSEAAPGEGDATAEVGPGSPATTSEVEPSGDAPEPAPAETPEPEDSEPADPEPETPEPSEVELGSPSEVPSGGGVAGAIVDPDDPNAGRAQSDLEGESLDGELAGVPERMPKLQAAGWWTTFSAVALATAGGVFAGVAEVREDEAERLAYSFDLLEGRSPLYGDVADDYERLLDEGNTYQWVARGLVIAGGATLVAGIALFAVDGAQRRKAARGGSSRAARVRLVPTASGLGLRF